VFRYAAQQDYLDEARNPVTMASIPGFAPSSCETCAYSLDQVNSILRVLSGPAYIIVTVAAFSGLRAGEIRGLRWEDYEPAADDNSLGLLHVRRSVWRKHTTDPKTNKSRSAVPVIPQLQEQLDSWRLECSTFRGPMGRMAWLPARVGVQLKPSRGGRFGDPGDSAPQPRLGDASLLHQDQQARTRIGNAELF
jgi:integrase